MRLQPPRCPFEQLQWARAYLLSDGLLWLCCSQAVSFASPVGTSGSSLTSESALDVGALIDALEKQHIAEDAILSIVTAVEAQPDITMDALVTIIKAQGVDTVKAHKVRSALTPASVLRLRPVGHSGSSVPISVG